MVCIPTRLHRCFSASPAFGALQSSGVLQLAGGLGCGKGANRWAVAVGTLPRGAVGIIYASIGKSLGVISDALFSAVVLMVIVTTLITLPLLKLALLRGACPGPVLR